jgi:hypothetical protein
MNLSVDASFRRQISELWMQYQRGLLPPKQPGEVRIDIFVEPPMRGPDAHNLLNFARAPEDFVRLLKQNRIPHTRTVKSVQYQYSERDERPVALP